AAPLARPTIMASRASTVRCGENRRTPDGQKTFSPEMFRNRMPDDYFRAIQLHGGKESAVGQVRKAQCFTTDADEVLYVVIPRREVGITDRPVNRDSFPKIGLAPWYDYVED